MEPTKTDSGGEARREGALSPFDVRFEALDPIVSDSVLADCEAIDKVRDEVVHLRYLPSRPDESVASNPIVREHRILSLLAHPAVPAAIDLEADCEGAGWHTYTSNGDSISLSKLKELRGSVSDVLPLVKSILSGLEYIHARGIVHCSLCPDCVLVWDGQDKVDTPPIRIVSFHASKRLRSVPQMVTLTQGFFSPPSCEGRQPLTPRIDLYAVGAIAAYLLCDAEQTVALDGRSPAEVLEEVGGSLPKEALHALRRTVSADETLRPPSVWDLHRQLGRDKDDCQPHVRPASECGLVPRASLSRFLRTRLSLPPGVGCSPLVLTGPPGSGKTTAGLLYSLECRTAGMRFVACCERQPGTAGATVSEELRRFVDSELGWRSGGGQVLARRRKTSSVASAPDSSITCGSRSSVLLFADDVDLLSVDEQRKLGTLIAGAFAATETVVLVVTCEPSAFGSVRDLVDCIRDVSNVEGGVLSPDVRPMVGFSSREIQDLVSDATCSRTSPSSVSWLTRQTDGNPLFVRELVSHLVQSGRARLGPRGLEISVDGAVPLRVPQSIESVLTERVVALSPDERCVAEALSIGPGMTCEVLSEVCSLGETHLQSAMRSLRQRGILRDADSTRSSVLASDLLRDVVCDLVDPDERKLMHDRAACIWQRNCSPQANSAMRDEVIAFHLYNGSEPQLAVPFAVRALDRTAEALRVDESAAFLAMLENLREGLGEQGGVSVSVLLRAAKEYWNLGVASLCIRACELGRELLGSDAASSPQMSLEFAALLGKALSLSGDLSSSESVFSQAMIQASEAGDDEGLVKIQLGMCLVHQMRGEFQALDKLASDAVARLDRCGRSKLQGAAYSAKGNALLALCDWEEAKEWHAQAIQHERESGNTGLLARSVGNLGLSHFHLGEWSEAQAYFDEALSYSREIRSAYSLQLALGNLAMLRMRQGHLDDASDLLQESLQWGRRSGDDWGVALSLSDLGETEHQRGNRKHAQTLFARSEELMAEIGSRDDLPELKRRWAESLIASGQLASAADMLDDASRLAESMGNPLEIANCLNALANLQMHSGRPELAIEAASKAADRLRRLGARYELGLALANLGRARLHGGDTDEGIASLETAHEEFRQLGARRDARNVQEELAAATGDTPSMVAQLPSEKQRLAALYRSSHSLASVRTSEALAENLADIAAASIPVESVGTLLVNSTGDPRVVLSTLCGSSEDAAALRAVVFAALGQSADGQCEPVHLNAEGSGDAVRRTLNAHGVCSALVIPISLHERMMGALCLVYRSKDRGFSDEDVRFLAALSTQAATFIDNVEMRKRLTQELESLRWIVDGRHMFSRIVGQSLPMQNLFAVLEKVARTSVTALLEGESGTGKELVARAIHQNGPRKDERFVAQNCAALPEQLLESELFGHVRGAFTGAHRDKPGLFEAADGGTFFLDEIADMPLSLQVKLLRVLQDGEIRRVGATDPIGVDVRIIAATNKSLRAEVDAGRFREDLYYRLDVVRIEMPPLRDRRDDIPLLAQHFLNGLCKKAGEPARGFTDTAMEVLVNYDWPGNVRELENEIQRAVALSEPGSTIATESLSDRIRSVQIAIHPLKPGARLSLKDMVEDVERRVIVQVLNEQDWNKSKTAQILGLSRQGLLKKIARFGLKRREES
jgi:transcriptional regulator with GAF, ATPase, and Fis domain/Tfp pilus assembly protein PilF